MQRLGVVAFFVAVSSTAMAQAPQRLDITVRDGDVHMPDWGRYAAPPIGMHKGLQDLDDAIDEANRRKAQRQADEARLALERERLEVSRQRLRTETAKPTSAAQPQDPMIAAVAAWENVGPTSNGALIKLNPLATRSVGTVRLVQWGALSASGALTRAAVIDCLAKTIEAEWPTGPARAIAPGTAADWLYAKVCSPKK